MSDEDRQYGVLLVSGGQTHQENYARAFEADPRCRLIGLTDETDVDDRRRALNRQLAQELGIPVLDDPESALAREDVDIVCLCPEPERRGRLTVAAARAGKHVYVDKPLAATPDDARQVVTAVREAGVRSQMFSLVRSSLATRAREIVESGRLGTLVGLHCEMLFAKGDAGTADLSTIRAERVPATEFSFIDSKRELFCVGLYPLVMFQWLTGGRVTEVTGSTSNYFFAEHQGNDVEDFACLLMHMDGGVDATVMAGRAGWASHPSHGIQQVHLIGTEQAVTVDAYRPRLEVWSDAEPWRPPSPPHPEDPMGFWSSTTRAAGVVPKSGWRPVDPTIKSDASFFVDCVENGVESDVPASVGAHAVEIIHAGYASATTGSTVSLDRSHVE